MHAVGVRIVRESVQLTMVPAELARLGVPQRVRPGLFGEDRVGNGGPGCVRALAHVAHYASSLSIAPRA